MFNIGKRPINRMASSLPYIKVIAALLLLILLAPFAVAHPPSDVRLAYDSQNQSLKVTTTHVVSNPSVHYVYKIIILRNEKQAITEEYKSQPSSTFTYDYSINASPGDVLRADAYCIIAGSKSAQITVANDSNQALHLMQAEDNGQDNPSLPLDRIRLPAGFKIEVYAENLTFARSMALSPDGTLFVGSRRPFETLDAPNGSTLYAIVDRNKNNRAESDEIFVIASGLNNPNGVAFKDGSLYVAEIDRIIRFDDIEFLLDSPKEPVVVKKLPQYLVHGWRYIGFGPDGKLYVAMGGNCNVCQHDDELNATIVRMNQDGSDMEVFAKGVRNSVGFDWDPRTDEMWFTDNGRDELGNDVPSDELNHAPVQGLNFGFPSCHSGSIPDPDLGSNGNYTCNSMVPPAWMLGPHVAPLGMRFYEGTQFPEEYQGQIFIAEHGSWNRDTPIGYRLALVRLQNNTAVGHEIFADGWLQNETAWGRPVDVQTLKDGSLLVSDDLNGVIYRISYSST
jgi:glucose/arabinose dehydrogenase